MTAPQPPNEEQLFSRAAELPPAERAAYLDTACAGDPALRSRIEALLHAAAAARSFMESPPAADLAQAVTQNAPRVVDAAVGDRIGRYKLLQKLGEGGCGVVFMAEQEEPVRRRVALKVIKLGMDTKEVVARFEAERQALALMDHANIARVFDAGATDSGRPFFVMELVRGIPITKFCDEQNLPTARRLDLFSQVCHAVQHAHQKGIIHRDLKPSNILVTLHDGVPVPKVIDFGIAKATHGRLTDNTLFTAFEQFIGTPAYMSPEQAELSGLDIDTRSDIYSLGVLLYELLTGRPPFDPKSLVSAGLDEIRRIIREVEPPRPSTRLSTLTDLERATIAKLRGILPAQLSTLLRGDLDWIVMRCLEKDRTRRYESANGLALDLLRHLHDEPVAARPPSAAYRFQKLVRRHKFAFAAAAAVALALVAGTIVSTWQAVRAGRAERQARADRALADQRRTEVEGINRFLVNDMLGAADPHVAQGRDITVKEVLANATARIPVALVQAPLVEAAVRQTIGATYSALGEHDQAELNLGKALEARSRLLGEDHPDTLHSFATLGVLRRDQFRQEEALTMLRRALERQTRTLGETHEQTLNTASELSFTLNWRNTRGEGMPLARKTLALARRHLGPEHRITLSLLHMLSGVNANRDRLDEAERLSAELLATQRRAMGESHPHTLGTVHDRGALLLRLGRLEESEALLRGGVESTQRVMGAEHQVVWRFRLRLAHTLERAGKSNEARQLLESILTASRKTGPAAFAQADAFAGMDWRWRLNDLSAEDSRTFAELWLELLQAAPTDNAVLGAWRFRLGESQRRLGDPVAAEKNFRQSLALVPADAAHLVQRNKTESRLGMALLAQGKLTEAEPVLTAAYERLHAHAAEIGTDEIDVLPTALEAIVQLYTDTNQPAKAAAWEAKRAAPRPP